MNKAIILGLSVLILTACFGVERTEAEVNDGSIRVGYTKFKKINLKGVDCVVGYGIYDGQSPAISCDWSDEK